MQIRLRRMRMSKENQASSASSAETGISEFEGRQTVLVFCKIISSQILL
jgi:hypothetical protein